MPEITENELSSVVTDQLARFLKQLQDNYSAQMQDHPLKAEIIATTTSQ